MGLDFDVIGVTLSNKKVSDKGIQHFINNERYKAIQENNENMELNFDMSFRKPDKFADKLLKEAYRFEDETNEYSEPYYVLNHELVIDLLNSDFNEETFKDTHDLEYYYTLMRELHRVPEYYSKHYSFYLIMQMLV